MKKINLNKIAVLLVSLVVLSGCVKDDNFDVPAGIEGITEYPNSAAQFNSLSGVLGAFGSNGNSAYTYEAEGPTVSEKYTVGYVVSSDEGGNFYKQLVIQDAPENPTAAIVVQVDKNPLFTQYEFGRKVFVKLNGLTVGESNGVLQLGRLNGDQIDEIAREERVFTMIEGRKFGDETKAVVKESDFPKDEAFSMNVGGIVDINKMIEPLRAQR